MDLQINPPKTTSIQAALYTVPLLRKLHPRVLEENPGGEHSLAARHLPDKCEVVSLTSDTKKKEKM